MRSVWGRRPAGTVALAFAALCACGPSVSDGMTARLPRNLRESVHRDHPTCRGRGIRGREIGPGQWEIDVCGAALAYYVCPTGPQSRWRRCTQQPATSGGQVVAAQPQPTYVVVTGGAQGTQTIVAAAAPAAAAPAPTSAPAPSASPPAAAPTMEQIEAAVRQWLDSHRAEILACTRTAAALVEVRWNAQGVPSVALGGEMHGSAGEPCVVQALSGVQFAVAGQAGAIRHVVQ